MNAAPSYPPNRLDKRAFEAMTPYLTERFGNAASLNHSFGWAAQEACDRAREQTAAAIHAHAAREVIFTGSGHEAATLAVKGVALAYAGRGNHIIAGTWPSSPSDQACRDLETAGYRITRLSFDRNGRIDPDMVRAAVSDRTILTTIPLTHDELGVLQPVDAIADVARATQIPLHVDGGALLDRIPVDVETRRIDLLSMDGPALYGPEGVGALFVRGRKPRIALTPMIDGGGQERGWRSGTLNVPGIAGMGAAWAIVAEEQPAMAIRLQRWTKTLIDTLTAQIDGITPFDPPVDRVPGVAVLSIDGVDHDRLAEATANAIAPATRSPVRLAPLTPAAAQTCGLAGGLSIRLCRYTTEPDITRLADALIRQIHTVQQR